MLRGSYCKSMGFELKVPEPIKKSSLVMCAYKHSAMADAVTGGFLKLSEWQPSSKFSKRLSLEGITLRVIGKDTWQVHQALFT